MKNFVQNGDVLQLTAPTGGVASGDVVAIGAVVGVAVANADEGKPFQMKRSGVFTVPKVSAQAWTEGAKVYWTGTEATTTASGNTLMGFATAAAVNPSATGSVCLNGTA